MGNDVDVFDGLLKCRIVAIFRGDYRGRWRSYVERLLAGGIKAVEITMNSADALSAIAELRSEFGDQILLGAGTVLTAQEAAAAIDAGAQFIVAPDTDEAGIAANRSLETRQPITIKDLFDLPSKKNQEKEKI